MFKLMSFLAGLIFTLATAPALHAQSGLWLQIEAQPNQAGAEDRARAYAALFPDVAGFATGTGWYAIALGPYADRALAQEQLSRLRREGLIPQDSFVAEGRGYGAPFWPPARAPEAQLPTATAAPVPEGAPAPAPDAATAEAPAPEVAPAPEETPAQAAAGEAALSPEQRRELQIALQWFGHYNAAIDGAIGPGTRRSMAAWQTAMGLEPTGILTTAQRSALLQAWRDEAAALGLRTVNRIEAGIEIAMPTALVEFDRFDPPFVHYREKDGSGVKVVLISQPGDVTALHRLYNVMQTLADVPLEGERSLTDRSFTIDGRGPGVASHSYAELSRGLIKGYMLVWNPANETGISRVREAMEASFRAVGDHALDPGLVPLSEDSRQGMLSGLEIRRPALSRSGFFVDAEGTTLTTRDVVEGCNRITIDLRHEAEVIFSDAPTGLALLRPKLRLAPPEVAGFLGGQPRVGQEIVAAGFSYEDALPAPTMSFGQLADLRSLDGDAGQLRLDLRSMPGDAGGPVLDASGAVIGMLLPRADTAARRLPEGVSHAAEAATIAARLTAAGRVPRAAESRGALAPEDLDRIAQGMTVLVSCW